MKLERIFVAMFRYSSTVDSFSGVARSKLIDDLIRGTTRQPRFPLACHPVTKQQPTDVKRSRKMLKEAILAQIVVAA
jgi:hypothetical protein